MKAIELTPEHPVEEVRRLAERAERAGFDTIFASNHYNNRDPFQTLSSIAAATDSVQLGPGVVNPYETHPVRLASRMATLDESSDGRGVFGIGAGDASTLANLGVERDSPLRRVLETFKVAQQLWTGDIVDHDGTFRATDASLNYEVGEIPVYVGAQGPHMLRMSGKHADGVLVNAAHPADLSWSADRIEEGRSERPDDRGDLDVAAYASISVAESEDRAREAADAPIFTDQVLFHPWWPQRDLLRYCQDEDVLLTGYSPLANGGLLGDDVLGTIGERYDKSGPQVALRWATQHENVLTIPQSTNRAHLAQNLDIFDFKLSRAEHDRITRPSKLQTGLAMVRGQVGL